MNKKGKKSLGIVLLLSSFLLIGLGVYLYVFSPKNIMLKMLVKEFEILNKTEKQNFDNSKNILNGFLEIGDSNGVQKFDFDSTIHSDLKNNNYLFEGGLKVLGNNLFSAKIFTDKNKLYFKLSEKEPLQYIEFAEDKDSMLPFAEIEEVKTILGKEILKALPDSNFSKSKENTTINKNNLETEKYTMKVTMLDFYNIFNNTFLEIRSNKKIVKINETIDKAITASKQTEDKFLEDLKKEILGEKNEHSNEVVFQYYIYTLKDKVVKHEFKVEDSIFVFGKYEKETDIFDYEFIVKEDNKIVSSLAIVGAKNSNKIDGVFEDFVLEGQSELTETKETIFLKAFDNSSKSFEIVNFSYEKTLNNNNGNSSNINVKVNLTENEYFNVMISNSESKNVELPVLDTTGATKFNLGEELQVIPISLDLVTSSMAPIAVLTVIPAITMTSLLGTVKASQNL